MTDPELRIAEALLRCSFLPGSRDKKFVQQLPNWHDRAMTTKGKAYMMALLQKYRKQIPDYQKLLNDENNRA